MSFYYATLYNVMADKSGYIEVAQKMMLYDLSNDGRKLEMCLRN